MVKRKIKKNGKIYKVNIKKYVKIKDYLNIFPIVIENKKNHSCFL